MFGGDAFSSLSILILQDCCSYLYFFKIKCLNKEYSYLFINSNSVIMLLYQWNWRHLPFSLYPYLLYEQTDVPTMKITTFALSFLSIFTLPILKMTTFAFSSLSIFTLSASCCTNNENDDICLFLLVHTYSMRLLFLNKMFKSRIQFLSWMVMVEYLRVRGVCHSIRHPNDRAALLSVK